MKGDIMIYTVKRIEEDVDYGCEERPEDVPVMAVVTLTNSLGEELVKMCIRDSSQAQRIKQLSKEKQLSLY